MTLMVLCYVKVIGKLLLHISSLLIAFKSKGGIGGNKYVSRQVPQTL